MNPGRLDNLMDIVKAANPAAYPFLSKLALTVHIVDNTLDRDREVDAELLSMTLIDLVRLSHTDPWARERMNIILPFWVMAHVYWCAANKMEKGPVRGVLKDKFNDLLIWAIAETTPQPEVEKIIAEFPYEQT